MGERSGCLVPGCRSARGLSTASQTQRELRGTTRDHAKALDAGSSPLTTHVGPRYTGCLACTFLVGRAPLVMMDV
ncbi:hypothetical protein NDU88_004407 [Pleurodeles waltl]|uniref:Uncharacterized protein n=1 Tax=Pleurodeles waltl TaxID=8319 RepID=A0AAV7UFD7_PLEWA|nr:hypothetical protein NDU88_004407 [Pleurodeles waltl]